MNNPPRKILSLKKPAIVSTIPVNVSASIAEKEAKALAWKEANKIKSALLCRLKVHLKATTDLKTAKHPMRIICLQKMLIRLNSKLKEINKIIVSYDDNGKQIQTPI